MWARCRNSWKLLSLVFQVGSSVDWHHFHMKLSPHLHLQDGQGPLEMSCLHFCLFGDFEVESRVSLL